MGLALGEEDTGVVRAVEVVRYEGAAAAAAVIAARARRHGADAVVIGLPLDVDGRRTPACRRSEALAAAVAEEGLAVELQAEYLSSDEARRRARSAGLAPGAAVDHLAAAVILEDFLAARRRKGG